MILNIALMQNHTKKTFSGPPIARICDFCLLLSLRCSSASLFVRFMSPSKTACGSTPVQFSPPSPVCKNDCMHSTCNFGNLVCNLLSSLCLYCFTHPFLVMVFHFCLKKCFPPSLGSMILNIALMQNHTKKSFSGPPIARITTILGLFMAPGICKSDGEMCIFSLCTLFGSFVCHYVFNRLHFG